MASDVNDLVQKLRYSATLLGSQMDGNGGTPTPGVLETVKAAERDLIALIAQNDDRTARLEAAAQAAVDAVAAWRGSCDVDWDVLCGAVDALTDAQAGPTEGDANEA